MADFRAYIDDFNHITIIIPKSIQKNKIDTFEARGNDETLPLKVVQHETSEYHHKYVVEYEGFIFLNKSYTVHDNDGHYAELFSGKIVRTEAFDDLYSYEGKDLGVRYTPNRSTFKLWTPVAKKVTLVLLDDDDQREDHALNYDNQGVWSTHIDKDLDGFKYRYLVYVNGVTHTVTDPYGVASNANGEYNFVINPENCYQMKAETPEFSSEPTDAIIYEMSIRDFSIDESIKATEPGMYQSAIEEGLKTAQGNQSGFDYLTSLGITHAQIMPFYDFEGVDENNPKDSYNWGYNPSQYFVPEGSFTKNPNHPYERINALRKLVDTFHKNNLRVVMDVVYNHVYDLTTFPFEKLVPGYAYRYDQRGIRTNVSGCGNDLATERNMVRKLIIDNIMFWTKQYGIDGYRFDLMGLIDIKTMHKLRQRLEHYRKDIIVYGEGWDMPAPLPKALLAHQNNKQVLFNIGFFNDAFRELIKGGTFDLTHKGYALGNPEKSKQIKQVLLGSSHKYIQPAQSINYVACHDNHTLFDKITLAMEKTPKEKRQKYQELATAMVLLAQGVPFIHMGQEFFRTKDQEENSYQSPDRINKIDWDLIDKHQDAIARFKKLIEIRKANPLLRLRTKRKIAELTSVTFSDKSSALYRLDENDEHLLIIFKNNDAKETISLDRDYEILFSHDDLTKIEDGKLILSDISATVLKGK